MDCKHSILHKLLKFLCAKEHYCPACHCIFAYKVIDSMHAYFYNWKFIYMYERRVHDLDKPQKVTCDNKIGSQAVMHFVFYILHQLLNITVNHTIPKGDVRENIDTAFSYITFSLSLSRPHTHRNTCVCMCMNVCMDGSVFNLLYMSIGQ